MVCTSFTGISTFADFIVWPTGCFYYFYLAILFAIWLIIAWNLMKGEEDKVGKGDFISAGAISSILTLFLGVVGTLIENSDNIPMIQTDVLVYLIGFCIVWVVIWIFKD